VDTLRQRRDRLVDIVAGLAQSGVTPQSVARAAAEQLRFDAAAITVADPVNPHVLGAYGDLAERLEGRQLQLGDGPTLTALARNGPVVATAAAGGFSRWPAFEPDAAEAGVTSLLALPLRPRRAPPAALALYSTRGDHLDDQRIGDALLLSDLVAEALVNPSPQGLHERLTLVGDDNSAVHHATGILAARRSVSPAEALSLLRAQAAATQTDIADLAAQLASAQHRQE
jgi:hypothetical protein